MDFAQARRMMVDSQLRTFDVNDVPLLDAMGDVPRERFVLPGRGVLQRGQRVIYASDPAPASLSGPVMFRRGAAVAQRTVNPLVVGSNPTAGSIPHSPKHLNF